jgi:hypothetical protein
LGSAFGFLDSLLDCPFLHEFGNAWGFTVDVMFGHADSIGLR